MDGDWNDVTPSLATGGCVCTRDVNDVTNVASPLFVTSCIMFLRMEIFAALNNQFCIVLYLLKML